MRQQNEKSILVRYRKISTKRTTRSRATKRAIQVPHGTEIALWARTTVSPWSLERSPLSCDALSPPLVFNDPGKPLFTTDPQPAVTAQHSLKILTNEVLPPPRHQFGLFTRSAV